MNRNYLFNLKGVTIYTLNNFLTDQECDYLCELVEHNPVRSGLAGEGEEQIDYSENRTSSTAYFNKEDRTMKLVDQKIAIELGIPLEYGEQTQGQIYQVGQEFKNHTDFFSNSSYINQGLVSGQRTWTVMIYLNEVAEGGYTEFPILGQTFIPKKGTAVIWKNSDGKGTENPATLHSGKPVRKGKKIIITKWFRENRWQPEVDIRQAKLHHERIKNGLPKEQSLKVASIKSSLIKEAINKKDIHPVKIEYVNGIPHARYKSKEDIPRLTEEGFKKMPIPPLVYGKIYAFYANGKLKETPEFNPTDNGHLSEYIASKEVEFPTKMIPLTEELRIIIFDGLQKTLEEWVGRKIERTHCYGIRTYNRGSVLKKHTDGFDTRIISAIINVDQGVNEPWALQIDDHQGIEHEVYLAPGEMVLYESAILRHGRIKPLNGDYYSNLFVHYVNLT